MLFEADLNDGRDFAFLQFKGDLLQFVRTAVATDRRNLPIHRAAGGIDGILPGQSFEFVGVFLSLFPDVAGPAGIVEDDRPGLHSRSEVADEGLLQFFFRHSDVFTRQLPQGQQGPDRVATVFHGGNVPFGFRSLQVLIGRQSQVLRLLVDFFADFSFADFNSLGIAGLLQDFAADEIVKNFLADPVNALFGQLIVSNMLAADASDVCDLSAPGPWSTAAALPDGADLPFAALPSSG